ncbi:MAG TPA: glycosyltransferase family 2 protein [Nitrospiraceae bacterium]|nr:glycosyltransferase family 2 protein [Nitrospiraceae bacterium]
MVYTSTVQSPLLSVVVPCYNEEAVIRETHRRLAEALMKAGCRFEIVYVNDGSRDHTLSILIGIQAHDQSVRIVSLSRNFGHQMAVSAGIDHAIGDAVVLIDADLQDPPEIIAQMVEKWREGYDVVYGQRHTRTGESFFKVLTARWFYRFINRLSDVPIPVDTGDFRLMSRQVIEVIKRMPERDRFIRGMVSWVGFKQFALTYKRAERFAGKSKYPLRKMVTFATDGILSFSIKPLRLSTTMGFVASGLALAGIVYALVVRLLTSNWVSGWTFIMVSVLFLGGVQLICLGIIGEYIGRIYSETKRRPLYLVERTYGFERVHTRPEQHSAPALIAGAHDPS